MRPKFDINNFEQIKNKDIKFECEICLEEFNSSKKYLRRALGITKHPRPPKLNYCSKECKWVGSKTGKNLKCSNCKKDIYRNKKDIKNNESGEFFCSNKCKGINWNKNKSGYNRSKLEIWIEEELKKMYNFEISFNERKILESGYEIDIYIPHLKLGFELNGIFHYEPIFGEEKLKVTEEKDIIKIKECIDNGIELFVIDTTDSKRFDKVKDIKYLNFILEKVGKIL